MINDAILNILPTSDLTELSDEDLALAMTVKVGGKKLYHHSGKIGKALNAEKVRRETVVEEPADVVLPRPPAAPADDPEKVLLDALNTPSVVESFPPNPTPSRLSVLEFCERVLIQQAALGTVHDSPKKVWHSMRQAYRTYVVLCETAGEINPYSMDLPQWATLNRDPDTGERLGVPRGTTTPAPTTVTMPPPPAGMGQPVNEGNLVEQLRREHGGSGNWGAGAEPHEGSTGFTEVEPVVLGQG